MKKILIIAMLSFTGTLAFAQTADQLVSAFEADAQAAQQAGNLSCINTSDAAAQFEVGSDYVGVADAGATVYQRVYVTTAKVGVQLQVGQSPALTVTNYYRGSNLADLSAGLIEGDREKTLQVGMNTDGTNLVWFSVTEFTYTSGAWATTPTFIYSCSVQAPQPVAPAPAQPTAPSAPATVDSTPVN